MKQLLGVWGWSLALLLACGASHADLAVRISSLTEVDHQFLAAQKQQLEDLSSLHLGRRFNGQKDNDLSVLQALLDRRIVKGHQRQSLQAMGIIMGNLLAKELDLHWVIYEDKKGRSRALRYKETDNYLFPMTMISRRREVGNDTPVREIYDKAAQIMRESKPALPFR